MQTDRPFSVIGHDPGCSGALALLVGEELVDYLKLPYDGNRIDVNAVRGWMEGVGQPDLMITEELHGYAESTPKSIWKLSRAESSVVTVGELLDYKMWYATPLEWHKAILQGYPVNGREQLKKAATDWCVRKYPVLGSALRIKANQDIADAVCIAEFGRRLLVRNRIT